MCNSLYSLSFIDCVVAVGIDLGTKVIQSMSKRSRGCVWSLTKFCRSPLLRIFTKFVQNYVDAVLTIDLSLWASVRVLSVNQELFSKFSCIEREELVRTTT
jgi:hypothetical protein